jgi:hypothetical protein
MADRRPLIINASANQIQEFTDSDSLVLSGQSLKFLSPLIERVKILPDVLSASIYTHNLITDGNLLMVTGAPSAPFAINLTGSTGVDIDDVMDVGNSLAFSMFINAGVHFLYTFTIDGSANLLNNIYWQGGADPQTRAGTGYDNYSFTLIKTGTNAFQIFGALANHAQ